MLSLSHYSSEIRVLDTDTTIPHLQLHARGAALVVNQAPVLLVGGQLHNSSASTKRSIAAAFARTNTQRGNCVIAPVYWDLIEPIEGTYDFQLVDALLDEARAQAQYLVLLWFGAFKNAASTYAPRWVRADGERFARAEVDGSGLAGVFSPGASPNPVLSVFSEELLSADLRAFEQLMRHLAEHDAQHTVVMVQVENEVGLLRDSRDRSPGAELAWSGAMPAELLQRFADGAVSPELHRLWVDQGRLSTGNWQDVLGDSWEAHEVFMAWHFASYADRLAAAGKAIKALPMYANAWLGPQPGQDQAGLWPSGGPASRVLDVWKAAAPNLDVLSPDIYIDDARTVLATYRRDDNPLFVPESRFRASSVFLAVGHHCAFGFSVFGYEDGATGSKLSHAYSALNAMAPQIVAAQRDGRIEGFSLDDNEPEFQFTLAGLTITALGSQRLLAKMFLDAGVVVNLAPAPAIPETDRGIIPALSESHPYGLVIAESDDTFLLVGQGVSLRFEHDGAALELDHVEQGAFVDGQWQCHKVLNGDERLNLTPIDGIAAARIRVLR